MLQQTGSLPAARHGGKFTPFISAPSSRTPSCKQPSHVPRASAAPAAPPTNSVGLPPEIRAAGGLDPATGPQGFAQQYQESLARQFLKLNVLYPGLRIMNMDPPVFEINNFVTPEACARIISAASSSGRMAQSQVGGTQQSPQQGEGAAATIANIRTSSSIAMTQDVLASVPGLSTALEELMLAATNLFQLDPSQLRKSLFTRPQAVGQVVPELPQVAHYLPGQHFLAHEDAFPGQAALQKGYQRRATLLIYLNDVAEGGSTRFERLGFEVQPKCGKALLFFPAFSGGMPDARTLHTAVDAVNEKWVFQLWMSSALPQPPKGQAAQGKQGAAPKQAKSKRNIWRG